MQRGALILCGGKSSRMGMPKAMLPFGDESMLDRVIRLTAEVVPRNRIVIVAAPGQSYPSLPEEITLAHDSIEGEGPLEGLRVGLASLLGKAEAIFATACDVPLLKPSFIEQMFSLLEENEIAVPVEGKYHHPLAAVYRPCVVDRIETLLAAGKRRPFALFEQCETRFVPVDTLRVADPDLASLCNLNTQEEYQAALQSILG